MILSPRLAASGLVALALASSPLMPAHAQRTPVFQSGVLTTPGAPAKLFSDGLIGDGSGLLGDINGRGLSPFSITDSLGLGVCSNSGPTNAAHWAFCLGHDADGDALLTVDAYGGAAEKSIFLRKNGVLYEFPFAIGGIVGPATTDVTEVASWNNTTGTLLRQGAAKITDSRTAAITTQVPTFAAYSQNAADATAHHIWTCTIGTCDSVASLGNYDTVRGVAVATSGQTVDLVSAVAGYVINRQTRTSPYPSFPVTAVLNGTGICAADGCGTWGINTIVTDNEGQGVVQAHGPRFLFGAEFDVQVTSANTRVSGVSTGGSSIVQPAAADGFSCLYLDGAAAGAVAKWSGCFESQNGAATAFAIVGAKQSSGNSIASQDMNFLYFDAGGVMRTTSFAAGVGGILVASNGGASDASLALAGAGLFTTGDNGGFLINGRTAVAGAAGVLSLASNTNWTTVNVGNVSGALQLYTNTEVVIPNGKRLSLSGGAINSTPAAAPASPASGWYIYTDIGDASKLKAQFATGTVVTLATP